ncbi:hypothetical protein E6C50_03245 [Flavobacterium supellecticarium]|uniref:Uncharacterized protein n=1 Tax=Flavobacterium supellecticarium TaxID=2565924 RepID=A0A4S4A452_9FLAO|nr:hypothetical protein [Flavobacterium supellecticarium]THF53231.1 hypothetical protein E6C50_03245 [Flavobacterium supellecticarium]
MKNIQFAHFDKFNDTSNYSMVADNIYQGPDEEHLFGLRYELEEEEDSQYPLEDILDKFYLYISDFEDEENFATSRNVTIELSGELEDIKAATAAIIGKRVYNQEYNDEEGVTRVRLVIE